MTMRRTERDTAQSVDPANPDGWTGVPGPDWVEVAGGHYVHIKHFANHAALFVAGHTDEDIAAEIDRLKAEIEAERRHLEALKRHWAERNSR
jgi:hypothetical protein